MQDTADWRAHRGGYSDELVPRDADHFNALLLRQGVRGAVAHDQRAQLLGSPALWGAGNTGSGAARPLSSHLGGLSEMSATELAHRRRETAARLKRAQAGDTSRRAAARRGGAMPAPSPRHHQQGQFTEAQERLPLRASSRGMIGGDPLAEALYLRGPHVPTGTTTASFAAGGGGRNYRGFPAPKRVSMASNVSSSTEGYAARRQAYHDELRSLDAEMAARSRVLQAAAMEATLAAHGTPAPSESDSSVLYPTSRSHTPPRPRGSTGGGSDTSEKRDLLKDIAAAEDMSAEEAAKQQLLAEIEALYE